MISAAEHTPFVTWLRDVAPYVHAFRGKTFVIGFGGELVNSDALNRLVQDISLLHALGVRIVVVFGSRPQVQAQLALKRIESRFSEGLRITDAAALECAKEAAGEIRLDIEALFSQGLPNTPMAHATVRVVSGNLITAKPMGVVNGVDLQHTGVVRKVAIDTLQFALNAHAVVLLSPLGFSPTGEAFNLAMEDVASSTAVALHADKLIFLTETPALQNAEGEVVTELVAADADRLAQAPHLSTDTAYYLQHAVKAIRGGVGRAHLVPFEIDGNLLLELFTHDGIGCMVTPGTIDHLRRATSDDVGSISNLISPLEADGTLVPRGRDRLEQEIDYFSVLEHDRVIYGCAALYPFPQEKMGEMACLTIHPDWQSAGDGERLLHHIELRAKAEGFEHLFVLTTRTAHWFIKRGFVPAAVDRLPQDRKRLYNWSRKSQIFIKKLI